MFYLPRYSKKKEKCFQPSDSTNENGNSLITTILVTEYLNSSGSYFTILILPLLSLLITFCCSLSSKFMNALHLPLNHIQPLNYNTYSCNLNYYPPVAQSVSILQLFQYRPSVVLVSQQMETQTERQTQRQMEMVTQSRRRRRNMCFTALVPSVNIFCILNLTWRIHLFIKHLQRYKTQDQHTQDTHTNTKQMTH